MKNHRKSKRTILDQVTPESWAKLKKSIIKGEIQAIKTGPWYYKLFIAIFVLLFISILLSILGSGMYIFNASNNMRRNIEQNSQRMPEDLQKSFNDNDFQQ